MLLTEAVITFTAGAVAEFEIRKFLVCSSTDGAFVFIKLSLLLTTDTLRLPAEVYGVGAGSFGHGTQKIPSAEDEEVDDRHHGQKICREAASKHTGNKQRRVHICKIFYLDRYDVEKQNLHIREKDGKGEEHGKIHILRCQIKAQPRNKVHEEAVYDGEYYAGEKVDVELCRSPVLFESSTYHIIKIKGNERQNTHTGRIESKGHKSPHLPAKDESRVEGQIAHKHGIYRADYPKNHIGNGYIFHKVGDTKAGMFSAKIVDDTSGIFHSRCS